MMGKVVVGLAIDSQLVSEVRSSGEYLASRCERFL